MLKFLTHKLRTHTLNEDHPHQDKAEDTDRDSGTESDDEHGETEDPESMMESEVEGSSPGPCTTSSSLSAACSPTSYLDSALASDTDQQYDHHSSEEELEVINNPTTLLTLTCRSGSVTVPEKRKWSQVANPHPPTITSSVSCGNLLTGRPLPTDAEPASSVVDAASVAAAVASATVVNNNNSRPSSGDDHSSSSPPCSCPAVAESCSSSDEEVQGLLAAMAPVQFRASPPLDAHKPAGARSLSPPPKLFHYGGGGKVLPLDVSPRKRHRQHNSPRPPHVPRPCLDFEKMQQVICDRRRRLCGFHSSASIETLS
uniref:Uncharacterized protein n=1 Tax=Timema cristinae TaxID=61476 RepID=A0A7R9CDC3_TIMCR|nr:unnamed protein product [Timema cristinae]